MSEFQDRVDKLTAARQSTSTDKAPVTPLTPLEQLQMEAEARRMVREEAEARAQQTEAQVTPRYGSTAARLDALNQSRSQQ